MIEAVLVVLAYAGLTLWWLWPLPTAPAAAALIAHDPFVGFTDYYLVLWILAWGAHALSRSPLHLFDANVFHPAPASLAFSEHLLGHQPLFAPVYWISGNAVLAANVLLFAMQVACAATTYALVRRFASAPAAFLAGTLFASCPWRYETTQQFHLLGTQYLPLVVLFAERLLERGRRRDACFLAVAASLQVLSSVYFAFATVLLLAGYLPLALVRWRARLDLRRATRLAMALAVPAILLGATSLPYMRLRAAGLIPVYWQGNALGVEYAPAMVWRLLTTSAVGALGYLLGAVALLPPWRGRG